MCTIRDSFAALCYWIRELSYSIEKLSNTANTLAIGKNVGIRELSDSITELSNLFKYKLN